MEEKTAENDLETAAANLVEGMNFALVEMSIGRHRGGVKVNIVLHKKGGITLDDLAEAQKVLRPRFELVFPRENLTLEITSPGVSRKIKNVHEYTIFKGLGVSILVGDRWEQGIIRSTDDISVDLDTSNGLKKVRFVDIRKGRLT